MWTKFTTHYNPCKRGLLLTTTHVNEVCYSLQPMWTRFTTHYNPYERGLLLTTTSVNEVNYTLQPIWTRFTTHYNPCERGLLLTTIHVNEVNYSLQPMWMKAGTQNITFIFNIYMQIESTKFGTQRFFFCYRNLSFLLFAFKTSLQW